MAPRATGADAEPIVFVLNDDAVVRESLELLIVSIGWRAHTFESVRDFLASPAALVPSCLVLDIAMAELHGIELQEHVAIDRPGMPIVLIAGTACAPTTVQALSASELRFLSRPVRDEILVRAIANALERSRPAVAQWAHTSSLRSRYACLSRREREVMALVVSGKLNKQVGGDLGISEITVKAHRGSLMRKMRATSLPNLVTMASRLGFALPS